MYVEAVSPGNRTFLCLFFKPLYCVKRPITACRYSNNWAENRIFETPLDVSAKKSLEKMQNTKTG